MKVSPAETFRSGPVSPTRSTVTGMREARKAATAEHKRGYRKNRLLCIPLCSESRRNVKTFFLEILLRPLVVRDALFACRIFEVDALRFLVNGDQFRNAIKQGLHNVV